MENTKTSLAVFRDMYKSFKNSNDKSESYARFLKKMQDKIKRLEDKVKQS